MRITIFCHSLLSCWNHGNAHFLRGVVSELLARGHAVRVYEPETAWSLQNLLVEQGKDALAGFRGAYPGLASTRYHPATLNLAGTLTGSDLVLVHEWNAHALVQAIGDHHKEAGGYHLLFHDTHHRAVTAPDTMAAFDLSGYDGVLAFGDVIRDLYLRNHWAKRAWTWHEAADPRVFHPLPTAAMEKHGDLVWIGNWGDEERTRELHEFLLEPVQTLGLRATVYGVRYPPHALQALARAGIRYGGWLPNYEAPSMFARYRVTVHVPRRPYVAALPGIPTIRPFEALACGIPLISAPWPDSEHLFTPGKDFLVARDGAEMTAHLKRVLGDTEFASALAAHGRQTILSRHTCAHRVDELLSIVNALEAEPNRMQRHVAARRAGEKEVV